MNRVWKHNQNAVKSNSYNINEPTVFVVDDDSAMAESLRWLIESVGLKVQIFSNAQSFLSSYARQPGCLVLDIRMPGMSGLELQQKLREENVLLPIIFITGHGDVQMAVRAMKLGALDFLTKPFSDQILIEGIHKALRLDVSRRQLANETTSISDCLAQLTPREQEVMERVVQGKLNKTISDELGISSKTVELHRAHVMAKMRATSVAELVKMVLTHQRTQELKELV